MKTYSPNGQFEIKNKLAKQQNAKQHSMSLAETGFTFAEKPTTSGEIQEDGELDDLRCLTWPSERHIWDGARGNWFHETAWEMDQRSKMWYLCHGQIAAVTEERGFPMFPRYVPWVKEHGVHVRSVICYRRFGERESEQRVL